MFRTLSVVCAVGACGLLGWAAHTAVYLPADPSAADVPGGMQPEPASGLVVEGVEHDLGERPIGEYPVRIRVTNRADRPGEIVGYPGSCGLSCCFFVRDADRHPVPAGETVEVVGELDVRQSGPFEFEGSLFLNDGGRLRTVRLRITGVGVPPTGEKPHVPPP